MWSSDNTTESIAAEDKWSSPFGPNQPILGRRFNSESRNDSGHDPSHHDGLDMISGADPDAPFITASDDSFMRSTEQSTDATKVGVLGREVYAVHDAHVDWIDRNQGLMNASYTNSHGETVTIQFVHFTGLVGIESGSTIQRGKHIGYYSQIGESNLPHSHITAWRGKVSRPHLEDPEPYLKK